MLASCIQQWYIYSIKDYFVYQLNNMISFCLAMPAIKAYPPNSIPWQYIFISCNRIDITSYSSKMIYWQWHRDATSSFLRLSHTMLQKTNTSNLAATRNLSCQSKPSSQATYQRDFKVIDLPPSLSRERIMSPALAQMKMMMPRADWVQVKSGRGLVEQLEH